MQTKQPVARPSRLLKQLAGAMLLIGATTTVTAQTTTLGTRGLLSQPNPPVLDNAGASWRTYTRGEDYAGVKQLPLQFITLRSGKKLAVYVSVPANAFGMAAPGKFPAILNQNAYRADLSQLLGNLLPGGTTLMTGGVDKFLVKRGYISITVDVFGTGNSQGESKLLGEEEQDAHSQTVDWITRQPWFNGNLGLAGTSYLGITALQTAGQQHPAVKAVFATVPMGDAYRGIVGSGGLLNAYFLSYWLQITQWLSVVNAPILNPLHYATISRAQKDHVAAVEGWYLPTINDGLAGKVGIATDDGSFWSVRSPLEKAKNIKVPTFIVGGNRDIFQRDEPLLYEQIKRNANTKLMILPGTHLTAIATGLVDNTGNPGGNPPLEKILLQWFDQYLKGKPTGAESLPNVTQYIDDTQFGARYATTTDWPHPAMQPQRYYLRGNRTLDIKAPTTAEVANQISEAEAPKLSIGKALGGMIVTAYLDINDHSACSASGVQWSLGALGLVPAKCQYDANVVEKLQNAIIYETEPLKHDLYLNGPMQADIWMTATNKQAALNVRIDDVEPSGKARPLTNGLQSAAFRAVDESRSRFVNGVMIQPWHPYTQASVQPIVPGQPMLVPVEVFPTAALIKAGHRLRVAISSSNQAQGIWSLDRQAEANGNISTILSDPAHPSSIVLPVVPASALN